MGYPRPPSDRLESLITPCPLLFPAQESSPPCATVVLVPNSNVQSIPTSKKRSLEEYNARNGCKESSDDQQNRKRPCVSFFPTTTASIAEGEKKEEEGVGYEEGLFWYNRAQVEQWRDEARTQCRELRRNKTTAVLWINTDPTTRGFEQRACLERQRRRFIASQSILHYSTRRSVDRLATIAEHQTRYAVELAVAQAAWDYQQVYPQRRLVAEEEEEDPTRTTIEDDKP